MKARTARTLGTISASILTITVLSAPAHANAVGALFQSDAALTWCAQENGTTSGVFLDPCNPSQSSDLWTGPNVPTVVGQIVNAHSDLCLTGNNNTGVVDLEPCRKSPGQLWKVHGGGVNGDLGFQADSGGPTGYYLWQSNRSLQVRSTGDPSSPHDTWFYS